MPGIVGLLVALGVVAASAVTARSVLETIIATHETIRDRIKDKLPGG